MPRNRNQVASHVRCAATPMQPPETKGNPTRKKGGAKTMLWTIFVILLVLWLLGWVGFHVLGAYIHIVLVLALIVLFIQLFTGRRPVV
jgi:Flp pilus assembly protein TadB